MMLRPYSALILSLLLLGACKGGETNTTKNENQSRGITQDPTSFLRLQGFDSCAATDSFMRENLRRILKDGFDRQRLEFDFPQGSSSGTIEKGMVAESSPASSDSATNSSSGPQDFSRTNTQVAGVDEPDLVKTDGTTIYSISGSNIQITTSWPVASMQKIASLPIDGQPLGLLLTEDKKLVVIYHPTHKFQGNGNDMAAPQPIEMPMPALYPWAPRYGNQSFVRLAIYNVAQPAQAQLIKEHNFWGSHINLRREGKLLRWAQTQYGIAFPKGIVNYIEPYVTTQRPNGYLEATRISIQEFERRRAEIEKRNEGLIETYSLKATLKATIAESFGVLSTDDPLLADNYDCTSIYASKQLGELGYTTVTSLNIQDGQISQAAVLAPAIQLYASRGALYLANTMYSSWRGEPMASEGTKTYIHRFKYESPDSVRIAYQGSGVVDGYILNQFALDEYQDVLRIAVTVDDPSAPVLPNAPVATSLQAGGSGSTRVNRVLTLGVGADGLEELGRTQDLAPGELIYGVRFAGDKGYVVTFRQVDPLYTLDLRDPRAPKVVGELKVSGFSSYIHMIDDTHLLTVGQEVDPVTLRRLGLKISVFDVTDPSKPSEQYKYVVPAAYSETLYDHHAFNWFASRNLLALPVMGLRSDSLTNNWWDSYFAELQVFSIDLAKGIEPKGAIDMSKLYTAKPVEFNQWQWAAQPNRSIFADDYIYAISSLGISAVHQQDLKVSLKTTNFYP